MTAETEVAAGVVAYLRGIGWRVYQEVSTGYASRRADIVATWHDRLVWIVECKTSLSWDLLDQAEQWIGHAHRISVAVPQRRMHGSGRLSVEERAVLALRLGLFVGGREVVRPPLLPIRHRDAMRWRKTLRPEHEVGFAPAGSASGGYFTEFRATVRALVRAVEASPGIVTKDLVRAIDHHYGGGDAAAARNLVRFIGTDVFHGTGICARKGAGGWAWFVEPEADVAGRCQPDEGCAMLAAASCVLCQKRLCADHQPPHKCQCVANWGGCSRPGVKRCGCGRVGALCAAHELCPRCEERRERREEPASFVAEESS